MPISITVIDGPLAGQIFEFGPDKAAITIGRYEDRDIRYPAEFDKVSRAHATIAFEHGRYLIRPDSAVFVNDEEAFAGDVLPRTCTLRLGTKTGPRLHLAWSAPDLMPRTALPEAARRPAAARAAVQARSTSRRALVTALAALLAVAAAIGAWYATRETPIEERIAALRGSVYLVVVRDANGAERPRGTASVVAPGVLATNAHVADGFDEKPRGETWHVRSSAPPHDTIEIKSVAIHPHYDAFQKAVNAVSPYYFSTVTLVPGYDVALIRVDAGARLGPPLKIAPPETLAALDSAQPVALIGFPMENMVAGGTDARAPLPVVQVARIVNATDYFMLRDRPAELHLIQHAIPTRGGASGSPIFNARGEIVAYHNAGNTVMVRTANGGAARIANGGMVNFSQRADLVRELLDARAGALTEARQRFWAERLGRYKTLAQAQLDRFAQLTGEKEPKPALEREIAVERALGVGLQPTTVIEHDVPGPGKLLIAATGLADAEIGLIVQLVEAGKVSALYSQGFRNHLGYFHDAQRRHVLRIGVVSEKEGSKAMLRIYYVPFRMEVPAAANPG